MIIDNMVMCVIQFNTADWVCSKTPILLVTLIIQHQPQGESLYHRKSNICSLVLDVQEANVHVSQFYIIRKYLTGCWFASDVSLLLICGMW